MPTISPSFWTAPRGSSSLVHRRDESEACHLSFSSAIYDQDAFFGPNGEFFTTFKARPVQLMSQPSDLRSDLQIESHSGGALHCADRWGGVSERRARAARAAWRAYRSSPFVAGTA